MPLAEFVLATVSVALIFDLRLKFIAMRHRHYHPDRPHSHFMEREHHPRVSIGLFFIILGIALLVATNDLLNLGSVSSYFTWETAMIFVGVLLMFNMHFVGGVLLIAGGVWFLKDHIYIFNPETFKLFYWPAVIALIGLAFILSSLFKKKNKIDYEK